MQLLITTQTQENYGAHDWDGEGACPQYWKFKAVRIISMIWAPTVVVKKLSLSW
jgi:hypothetical protein